jgi:NAD(P)H-dependent FMN reductase
MSEALIVVGLGGSLAESSKSRAALQVALEGATDAGAKTQLLDLRRLDLPLYNPEDDEPTETAAALIEAVYAANGLLWSSPLYRGRSPARSRTRSTGCTRSALVSRLICTTR